MYSLLIIIGMQMSVGLGIPLQVPVSNKLVSALPQNTTIHLNPGVRTANAPPQKINNILPNNQSNNLHASFSHQITTRQSPNVTNQTFNQPHFVSQTSVVGTLPANGVNPSHQFMQPVQNTQIFMPVHPPQKKGT